MAQKIAPAALRLYTNKKFDAGNKSAHVKTGELVYFPSSFYIVIETY